MTDASSSGSTPGQVASRAGEVAGVAKDSAAEVGTTAKDAGTQVATTAVEQGKQVAAEAKAQARDLLGEARTQASAQGMAQKDKAVGGLRALADELGSMAEGGGQSGVATELARQASSRAHEVADWIESREPGDLLEEVRDFARRRTGTFLLGAALAGVVAGRLTRGAVAAAHDESGSPSSGQQAPAALLDAEPESYGTGYGTSYATESGTGYAGTTTGATTGTGYATTAATAAGAGAGATYAAGSELGSGTPIADEMSEAYGAHDAGIPAASAGSADLGSTYTDLGTAPGSLVDPDTIDVRPSTTEARP
ncbi:hypothetical protein [Motilibacter aurantiacus]|uniref:hypothetical protein n=1 Tax=Motilibacter aurantiacus TaxID=2714955 RepID=UPI001407BEF0|nr:hypothetical protein [Motilibacter aurantiacus]NHC47254.1 hypothetical protein [Motilibacter aurantiacus]